MEEDEENYAFTDSARKAFSLFHSLAKIIKLVQVNRATLCLTREKKKFRFCKVTFESGEMNLHTELITGQ